MRQTVINSRTVPMLFLFLVIGMSYYLVQRSRFGDAPKKQVLTSLPATFSLTQTLCQGTAIPVTLLPVDVPYEQQPAWFAARHTELQTRLRGALAVVTLRSVWPADPLFPQTRALNIQVVELDVATSSGVIPTPVPSSDLPGRWLTFQSARSQATILADDLKRLFPQKRDRILRNHQALEKQLDQSRELVLQQIAGLPVCTLVAADNPSADFLTDLKLTPHPTPRPVTDLAWVSACPADRPILLIAVNPLPETLRLALAETRIRLVTLDPIDRIPEPDPLLYFRRLGANASALIQAHPKP